MQCEQCHTIYFPKRTLLNWFSQPVLRLCEACLYQILHDLSYSVVPLPEGIIHHYSFMSHKSEGAHDVLFQWMHRTVKQEKPQWVFYLDELNEETIAFLEELNIKEIHCFSPK